MVKEKDSMFSSKSKYNLSYKILFIIGDRIEDGFRHYAQGDFDNFYFNLKSVKMLLIAFMSEDNQKGFTELEKKIANLRYNEKRNPRKYRGPLGDALEAYNKALQIIIKDVGVGLPTKSSTFLLFGQKETEEAVDLEEEFDGS